MKDSKKGTYINYKFLSPTTLHHTHTHTHTYTNTPLQTMLKVVAFTFCLYFLFLSFLHLLFNTVDRMNLICIFLARLCSFTILKVFLTHFFDNWYLLYQIVSQTSCDSFDKRMITANLI